MMSKAKWFPVVVAVVALVSWGCSPTAEGTAPSVTVEATSDADANAVTLCGQCGQIKKSDACCVEGAETCEKCSLAKGSPGCCKIAKGTDTPLCTKCGQVKGSDACCAEGAETCAKCGLAKGSPGCCKIGKIQRIEI